MKYLITVAAALASIASAQNFADIPTCAQAAAVTAFASTGCSITDVKCVCSNTAFISGVAEAIKSTCSAADQAATVAFAQKFCASAGVTLPATTLGGTSSTASAAPVESSASSIISSVISSALSSASESSAAATTSAEETSAAATTSAEETSAAATTSAAETSAAATTSAVETSVAATASATATYVPVPVPVPSANGTISTSVPTPTFVSGAVANAGSILLSIAMAGVAVLAL